MWIEKEIVDLCCNHNLIASSLILQQATGNFLLGNPVSGWVKKNLVKSSNFQMDFMFY